MKTNKEYILAIEKMIMESESIYHKFDDKLTDIVMKYKNDENWADNVFMNCDLCILYSKIITD